MKILDQTTVDGENIYLVSDFKDGKTFPKKIPEGLYIEVPSLSGYCPGLDCNSCGVYVRCKESNGAFTRQLFPKLIEEHPEYFI